MILKIYILIKYHFKNIQIILSYMSNWDSILAFSNGMVAGIIIYYIGWSQVFVMQPFEIIKVRLQTQSK